MIISNSIKAGSASNGQTMNDILNDGIIHHLIIDSVVERVLRSGSKVLRTTGLV